MHTLVADTVNTQLQSVITVYLDTVERKEHEISYIWMHYEEDNYKSANEIIIKATENLSSQFLYQKVNTPENQSPQSCNYW